MSVHMWFSCASKSQLVTHTNKQTHFAHHCDYGGRDNQFDAIVEGRIVKIIQAHGLIYPENDKTNV